MKNAKKYLLLFLIFAMIMSSITVFCINAAEILDETAISEIENEDIVIEHELMPMMASRSCYDYNTVDDCMRDISSIYGFSYSLSGNSYTCSGNYSVSINNSHNYLNVILSYNGSCIAMYTCSRR